MSLRDTIIVPLEVGCTNDDRGRRDGGLGAVGSETYNNGYTSAFQGKQTIDHAEFVLCQSQSYGADSPQYTNMEQPNIYIVVGPSKKGIPGDLIGKLRDTTTELTSTYYAQLGMTDRPLQYTVEHTGYKTNNLTQSPKNLFNSPLGVDPFIGAPYLSVNPTQDRLLEAIRVFMIRPDQNPSIIIKKHPNELIYAYMIKQSAHHGTKFDSPTCNAQRQNGSKANVLFTKVKIHNL